MRKTSENIMLSVIYMLFIISFSVVLTLNFRPLYYFDIGYLNIAEESGISEEDIKENYDTLIDYNVFPWNQELKFPSLAMSEPGRIHFEEVKQIFVIFEMMCLAALIMGVVGTIYMRRKKEHQFLMLSGIFTVVIPLVLGGFVAANWDKAFVAFHKIFFNNDYWIFDPIKDPVITILPDTFFLHCAVMILGGIVLGAIICFLAYITCRKKKAQ